MQPLVLPPSWQSSLDLAVSQQTASEVDAAMDVDGDPPVYLVRGPKKTGKSTFARTLINRLFNRSVFLALRSRARIPIHARRYRRVAFLECDLGQSEFTPAGMVALSVIGRPVFGTV
jgi:polynucleotide 5'-hydroxyl-kinase GRC3/NOL9